MTGRIAVGMVAVLLLVYLALTAGRAVILIQSGGAVEILFVVGLLILPIVGLWVLVHELRFGLLSGRLMRLLDEAGELSVAGLPPGAGRKAIRAAADADFSKFQSAADAAPNDWRFRFVLGLAYGRRCGLRLSEPGDVARFIDPAGRVLQPRSRIHRARVPLSARSVKFTTGTSPS